MKNLVYTSYVDFKQALVARIAVVAGDIRKIPGAFANVRQSLSRRYALFSAVTSGRNCNHTTSMHRWKEACHRACGARPSSSLGIAARHSTTPPPLTFEDHNRAFRNKSTWELVRALAVLRACSLQPLVNNSLQLMKWVERTGGEACLRLLLKRTLYEQFVGGETPRELRQCVRKVSGAGMRCMLAATMEEDVGQERSPDKPIRQASNDIPFCSNMSL
ncbi:proline dehydrogenase 1, mitochondrial [Trichonephila clavipes]|nr:proline dehydrogenase 1, mitochondrial [Trichonephila clavipes]